MPTYTTQADFEAYVEGWVTDDSNALTRLLERAERDIDSILGPWLVQDSGLKIDPTELEAWQADALNRATCAQAEYRFTMGEEFFVKGQFQSESGPDFKTQGKLPRIGPKVYEELRQSGLMIHGGRAVNGRRGVGLIDKFYSTGQPR